MGPTEGGLFSAAKVVNAGKWVVDFALSQVGLQLYDIVKGQVKIDLSDDTKKNVVMVEEMQQDVNKARQQSRASAKDEEERLKRLFDEPLKNATPEKPAKRKIFIRSRL